MKNGDKANFYLKYGWVEKAIIPVEIVKLREFKAHVRFIETGEMKCVNRDNLTVVKK